MQGLTSGGGGDRQNAAHTRALPDKAVCISIIPILSGGLSAQLCTGPPLAAGLRVDRPCCLGFVASACAVAVADPCSKSAD